MGLDTNLPFGSSENPQGSPPQLASLPESLQVSHEIYYRSLVELAVDGIMVGREGVVIDANQAMCEIFGLAREQVVGRHISTLPFSPESLEQKPFRLDLLDQNKFIISERVIIKPDASQVVVEMRARMMPDGAVQCFVRDVTERKREEAALRASENRYRQLFDLESDALFLIDHEGGEIIEANAAAATLYGYSHEEMLSMRNVDFSAEPEVTQQTARGLPQIVGNYVKIPLRLHRKADGSVFPVEITARFFKHFGRPVHIAAIRDITERKRTEDELRASEERLRQLADSLESRVLNRTRELEAANAALVQSTAQLRKLAMQLTVVEERERKRLALLLHDHLQPFLVAATLKVSLLAEPVPLEEQTRTVKTTLDLLQEAMNTARSLTMDLYPPILLDAGLMPGLRWLAGWIKEKYGLIVDVSGDEALEVPEALGILLFQTIRELLFNVAKHSQSDTARVTIMQNADEMLQVVVEDQGIGFPVDSKVPPDSPSGLGLFHLGERLAAMGGTLDIVSAVGQGSKVFVSVPLPKGSSLPEPVIHFS